MNIPMSIRWLHRTKRLAEGKLGRAATSEEIILEYKGLLKSKSDEKKRALKNFKENYDKLKNESFFIIEFSCFCDLCFVSLQD